ncbi:uncharacterized protein N7477_003221 [Penicillium maclennaniae]|uniref:uncharacterized protein n=1 Tax=Penicillium maclennaniae TaxID=1343394 RepID=UPI0025425530|nr:uncharacterized protein N7477_003221 [Penicillium maclennaniae]KAJ5677588.1 hypothetical protein N7477_003221 [Penicillium maclennaniae]
MASKQVGEEMDSEKYQSIGAKVAKQLSKRMSLSKSSSKETKESHSNTTATDSGINQTTTTDNASKETASESNFSKQALEHGGEMKDRGDIRDNQGTAEKKRKPAGRKRRCWSPPSHVFGHKPSINPKESNDDIKKGPITHGRTNQRNPTGSAYSGAGGSGDGRFNQPQHSSGRPLSEGFAGSSPSAGGYAPRGSGPHLAFVGNNASKRDTTAGGVAGDSNTTAANLTGSSIAKDNTVGGSTTGGAYTGSEASKSGTTGNKPQFTDTTWGTNTANAGGAAAGGTLAGSSTSKGDTSGSKYAYTDASKTNVTGDSVTSGAVGGSSASRNTALRNAKPTYDDASAGGMTGSQATKNYMPGTTSSGGGLSRSNATKVKPGNGISGSGMTGSDMSTGDAIKKSLAGGAAIGGPTGIKAGGQSATDDTIDHELSEQSHIAQDVFSSGAFNKDAAKGLSGGREMISHDPPSKPTRKMGKHKTAQQTSEASKGDFGQETRSAGQASKGMSGSSGLGMGAVGGALSGGTMDSGGLRQDMTQSNITQSSYNQTQRNMGQSSYGQTQSSTANTEKMSSTTTTTTAQPKRVVQNFSGGGHKATVLQDKVQAVSQKCKTQLGLTATEISQRAPNVDTFFDAVAAERLRWMPRDGSRLDCQSQSIGAFAPGADDAAKLIWGFEILLLESDLDNMDVFESVFGRYGRVAVHIHLLLQYESAYKSSPELQPVASAAYADLLEMVCSTTASCVEGAKSKESEHTIAHNVDTAFLTYAKRYSTHWNIIVEAATSKLVMNSSLMYLTPELGSLRQFLGVQDRPLQFILESRTHSLAEGSFEWFNNTLYDFSTGKSPVMLVTGGPGSGKSALAQWTVERLQESGEHDNWNVIPYTIRADIPVATLPLRFLKGIMHQMLDHCVSDQRAQEAILIEVARAAQSALDGAGEAEVEESLWRGIRVGLSSDIQYMFIVDGLDQMKAGDTDAVSCLTHFAECLSDQSAGSKMIAFTRPLGSKMRAPNIEHFTLQTSQTQADLETYVSKMMFNSQFDGPVDNQMESAVSVIVNRSHGSFSWAEMAVAHAQQQRTLSQAISAVQSLPEAMSDLLDFHMKNMDFSQHEARYIMSWLAAAERPLLVEEVEQLLAVDPQGPSFMSLYSRGEDQWFSSLKPLVMTRDGVVSFAHTSIRDHVIKQARSASIKSPLNLREAHYDLLTRCLAWVQLSVREEAEISMDKLSMEERNHLFDKYVMLEYTARYWLSHLLSSPLVTDDGEFQFTTGFKKLVPSTVLFARLELTCKESQYTRSSVVELYRLAADIRRLVLGEKSMALLQSLFFSSRVSELAHASHADEHSYEAWRLSQELLGQTDSITVNCVEMMTQSFTARGTMTTQQEDIMKYLILTDSEITGVEFNQRLNYLGMIVGMYKTRGDNESALTISKQFYQQIMEKYGTNSRQSNETAEFLTTQFPTTGNDEMSRDIARTKYDNMLRTMEVDDERRIKYTLYMAHMYEQQGETAQAQAVLSSLWAGLNSRDIDSVEMMDKKTNVALVYYQFLRRQSRNESAEMIIHELIADLESTGIHSEEMMQRVQLLRVETQEMHMYSMDRALAILMWRYYKESGQEYTQDASSLALSLAEGMAATVTMQRSSGLSVKDRKLMVELLDSIASYPKNLSVSTLILCHNLASIYVREGDWQEAGDCSKAVLQHIWPTVEQAGSHKKFSTELAPPIADLALVLAYCHFRRLHLDMGTVVYENAFASLISSDRVPVPSVLAVAKAVVEFYETTFQFTKALTLLHTVSNFLASRLGETHKHTIDNLYLEAALAARLEMNPEAKSSYHRIYRSTCGETTIAPDGIEAALALIGLYETESKWDSALEVYRHLWPTLVVQDNTSTYDESEVERLLEKTYLGYMTILTTQTGMTEFSERYKVASDYVTTCRNVYGPTDEKTLSALLLYAELCETNEAYTDQAIALYKQPLHNADWVPTSEASLPLEQMSQPLPITLKHKLAQLFVRRRDSTSEARSLYTEEFQLAKKTQGYFSTTTLSWLRELALAHSRQGTPSSVQQGNALLHTYVTDVLHAGGDPDMTSDWARKIASIYLECGFIEGGNSVLDELRHRVLSGSDTSAMALRDRRDAKFVASFEEVFGRRGSSEEIITEMYREMQIQQTFTRNLSGHDFIPTLISGDRLARLQIDQKRARAAKETRDRLYEYFCVTLSATNIADHDIVMQFYVRDLCNDQRFQDASDVTGVLHSFLHLTDGLNSYESIITATKLCLYLSGHQATKCQNEKLFNEMSVKSKMLLQELMAASKSLGIEIMDLPFPELNDIITLLGECEMFDDLETILTQLWTSRIVQRTWTPDVVVWIGRRLVETRFCRGSVDSAIQLCRDICYNLRQVWGSCDNVTLEMTKLLSALYTALEDHKSAATLHEGVLHDLLSDSEAKNHPGALNAVSQHMELLRRAQSRLGTEKSTRSSSHADLIAQVTDRFGLQSEQIEGVGDANGGEKFGVWSKPRRFSIDVEDLDDQGQMHHNHLRESSGAGLLTGSGAPRRISVQAL